jgi:hypothetical protein
MSGKSFMNDGGGVVTVAYTDEAAEQKRQPPAEVVEGRLQTKKNTRQSNLGRTQSRESRPSGLERVREVARKAGPRARAGPR